MSKAIQGAAMLAGAVGMGVAAFFDPALIASPLFDKVWAGLIMGGISMEAGAIADALTSNRGMTITTRQPAGLRQIIYGERRVGGVMVYESTTGSHHDQYNMVIILAGHEVDSIVNAYLDGRQIFWHGSGVGNVTRNGVNFGGIGDSSDHVGPDGTTYNFGGTGHSGLYCEAKFGDQAAGDVIGGLTANDPHWAASADGSPYLGGCTYVYLKIEDNASLFPTLPESKFTVRGKNDIYDPRTGTRGYSNNWALIVADIITNSEFGLGDPSVNEDQLIAAANICDEMVDLAGGGQEKRYTCNWMTDTSTSAGDMLQTVMQGAAGRLSRIGGEWYIWPAYWQGPTFEWDESILTDRVQWQPNRPFRELCNRVQGTYIAPNFPYNQTDTDGIANLYDANGWYDGHIDNTWPYAFQPTNYPQYAQDTLHGYGSDALLAEDGGILLPMEVTQSTVLSITQAQRVAKILLMRNRQQGSGTLSMHLKASKMQPLSVMTMDFARLGWSSKVLEVNKVNWSVDKDANGVPTVRLQMGVNETAASVYEWSTTEELSPYDVPSSPTQLPGTPDPPASLTLVSNSSTGVTSVDGLFQPRILASWTAPPDATTQYIQIQHQKAGDTSWIDDGSVSADTTAAYISGVVGGNTYNARIRGVRGSGATSDWVETDGCAVPGTGSSISTGALPVATGSTGGIITGTGSGITITGGVISLTAGGKKELSSAIAGQPAASQNVLIYTATVATTFPGNFASTPPAVGSVGTNPAVTATYTVKKNGSAVGTITISTSGVFTFATTSGAAIALAAGDRLTVVAPGTVDTTLADVSFTLVGAY